MLMQDNNKEENIYESLASLLNDRSISPAEKSIQTEDEELRKLLFVWDECQPEKQGSEEVWNKTLQRIKENDAPKVLPTRYKLAFVPKWAWGAVASVVLLIGLGFFFTQEEKIQEIDEAKKMEQYMLANAAAENVKEVTLVVSDKKKIELTNNAKVAYSSTGEVQVNSDQLDEAETKEEQAEEVEEYNQIIVPKGRRSIIVLADNSKIWVNSGSKVIYPRAFKKEKRQIYVEGEVYLKVAHNEAKPFIVSTSTFQVEVLGTSFNVSAPKGSSKPSVVLVEGAVDVKDRLERHIKMQPNERVELNEAGISKKEKVNALDYIHWVDGVWVLNGKPLKEVLKYIADYYGQTVQCDPSIENEPLYGKLFLNEDLNKVIESIRQSLPEPLAMQRNIIFTDIN